MLVLLIGLGGFSLNAQEQTNVIKTNILGPIAGQYQLAYERALTSNFSAQLSAGYLGGKSNGSSLINGAEYSYDSQRTGFIVIPEVRWYPFGEAPRGLFLGGFGRFRQANNNLTDSGTGTTGIDQNLSRDRKVTTIGGGAVVGFQWISKGGFSLDLFIGSAYKSRSTDTTYELAALNEASDNKDYDSVGDELFNQKYLDFKLDDRAGWGVRFGFHLGYAF